MKPFYQSLCTEFFDLITPVAESKELTFYKGILQSSEEPFLEAMCGSGRLLIPLLQNGFVIDGVDNSSFMLESCRKRCENLKLSVKLYNQSLQNMKLPLKYHIIFISEGSFQLIKGRTEALNVLKNLRQHLLPGGKLIIENFIPWRGIQKCFEEDILSDPSKPFVTYYKIPTLDRCEIIKHSTLTIYLKDQFEINHTRYEKWKKGKLLLAEEEEYNVSWYYRREMELFLEKAGFSTVTIKDETFEENPQALVYIAS